jgi:hypothetical protein
MNKKLKSIAVYVQQLPVAEQLELMQVISESLYHNYHHILHTISFNQAKTIEQLVHEQEKTPITDLSALAVDFWPENESVDDFIEYTYHQRQEDRLRD